MRKRREKIEVKNEVKRANEGNRKNEGKTDKKRKGEGRMKGGTGRRIYMYTHIYCRLNHFFSCQG